LKAVLFVKKNKPTIASVIKYLHNNCEEFILYEGERCNDLPKEAYRSSQDILISYISPWIIPGSILNKTKLWNINFHPGPPEYPGIGCLNFAIYNEEEIYGVTAHLMEEKVDRGRIIGVKRFLLLESDSVIDLSVKSYEAMLSLFFEVMDFVLKKNSLPVCNEAWKRKPYTRKELEELCRIKPDMSEEEVKRRLKATTYPNMPGAYLELFGYRFEYNVDR